MGKIMLVIGLIVSGLVFSGCTTYKYAVCSSGFNSVCIVTDNLNSLKKEGNCITDGVEQICGSYSTYDRGGYSK